MRLFEICEVCHAGGLGARKTTPTKYAGGYRFSLCLSAAGQEWPSAFGLARRTTVTVGRLCDPLRRTTSHGRRRFAGRQSSLGPGCGLPDGASTPATGALLSRRSHQQDRSSMIAAVIPRPPASAFPAVASGKPLRTMRIRRLRREGPCGSEPNLQPAGNHGFSDQRQGIAARTIGLLHNNKTARNVSCRR